MHFLLVTGLYLHAVTDTTLVVDTSRGETLRINVMLFSFLWKKKFLSFFSFYKTRISLQIFLRCWCNHFFYNIRSPLFLRAPESVLIYIYIYIYFPFKLRIYDSGKSMMLNLPSIFPHSIYGNLIL